MFKKIIFLFTATLFCLSTSLNAGMFSSCTAKSAVAVDNGGPTQDSIACATESADGNKNFSKAFYNKWCTNPKTANKLKSQCTNTAAAADIEYQAPQQAKGKKAKSKGKDNAAKGGGDKSSAKKGAPISKTSLAMHKTLLSGDPQDTNPQYGYQEMMKSYLAGAEAAVKNRAAVKKVIAHYKSGSSSAPKTKSKPKKAAKSDNDEEDGAVIHQAGDDDEENSSAASEEDDNSESAASSPKKGKQKNKGSKARSSMGSEEFHLEPGQKMNITVGPDGDIKVKTASKK
jgi:hypothetical protein